MRKNIEMHLSWVKCFFLMIKAVVIGIILVGLFLTFDGATADIDRLNCVAKHLRQIAQGADKNSALQRLKSECHITPMGNKIIHGRCIKILHPNVLFGPKSTETTTQGTFPVSKISHMVCSLMDLVSDESM